MGKAKDSDYLTDNEVTEIFRRISRNAGGATRDDLVRLYKRMKSMKTQLDKYSIELDSLRQPPLTFTELEVIKKEHDKAKNFFKPQQRVAASLTLRLWLMVKENKVDSPEWERTIRWSNMPIKTTKAALALAETYQGTHGERDQTNTAG